MEANLFIAEVYRRMGVRARAAGSEWVGDQSFAVVKESPTVKRATLNYAGLLPVEKDIRILDIGFGDGWFMAAALNLGYLDISGADFGAENKQGILGWSTGIKYIHNIDVSIVDFLSNKRSCYDVIHMSHVIEHIPKYYLLDTIDALYSALKPGGKLILRTPNMEAPCALSSLYVTLGHEYGFCGSNLCSLMHIGGFDNIQFHQFKQLNSTVKQKLGVVIRWPFLKYQAIKHRLFGVNYGGNFEGELIASGEKCGFSGFSSH